MGVQIERKGSEVQIREDVARNGPAIGIPANEKGLFIAALQGVNAPGPPTAAPGGFNRTEDMTSNPVGVFVNEADADIFLVAKGAGFSKHPQGISVDGFGWVVTQD